MCGVQKGRSGARGPNNVQRDQICEVSHLRWQLALKALHGEIPMADEKVPSGVRYRFMAGWRVEARSYPKQTTWYKSDLNQRTTCHRNKTEATKW
jgi:hypothetical protein